MENHKCLRVLQPNMQSCLLVSSSGTLTLNTQKRGKKRKNSENLSPVKCKRKDGIYTDKATDLKKPVKYKEVCVQTDSSYSVLTESSSTIHADSTSTKSVNDLFASDSPPTKYWEMLAEKRRKALEETLTENKSLYKENRKLESQITSLKEENKLLEDMVSEAKELASLVQSITGEED